MKRTHMLWLTWNRPNPQRKRDPSTCPPFLCRFPSRCETLIGVWLKMQFLKIERNEIVVKKAKVIKNNLLIPLHNHSISPFAIEANLPFRVSSDHRHSFSVIVEVQNAQQFVDLNNLSWNKWWFVVFNLSCRKESNWNKMKSFELAQFISFFLI